MFESLQFRRSVRTGFSFIPHFRSLISGLIAAAVVMGAPAFAAPFAYVALGGNKVAVLDVATNTVIQEIAVGSQPTGVAASPSGRFVYVTNIGSHNVSVIDTQTNAVTSTITPMSINGLPAGVAVNPAGSRLYVTNRVGEALSVIETASGLPIAQIPLIRPNAIAIHPAGGFAYVGQGQPNVSPSTPRTIAVIDLLQNRISAEIPVNATGNILFSPDGSRAYVVDDFEIAVINTATHMVLGRWPPRSESSLGIVSGIALSADSSRLYAVTPNSKRLNVLDTTNGLVLSRFTFENEPTGLIVNPGQPVAILLGERTNLANTVNLNTGEITKSYNIGGAPRVNGVAVTNGTPAQAESSSGGGGGCGYISGSGGPLDPTLPALAALALLTLALRRHARQR